MQAVFAHQFLHDETIQQGEKKLLTSVDHFYTLYFHLLTFLPALKRFIAQKQEKQKRKFFPSKENLNPNTKFIENAVILQLENNNQLNASQEKYDWLWKDQKDLFLNIMQDLYQKDFVQEYMNKPTRSYTEDKKFVLRLIRNFLVENTLLHWFLGEKNVYWADDFNDAFLVYHKTLEIFSANQDENYPIAKSLQTENMEDDLNFCIELYRKTIINSTFYDTLIEARLKNWEHERTVLMDRVLMRMAICEFLNFPSIPIKASLNEYIELAKFYSSPKSSLFVNGVLDNVLIDLKEQQLIVKTGRGLKIS